MLGLGFWEIVIIGLVGLIIVGPEKLPELAKSAAKFLNEMKRTANDFQSAINQEKDVFKEDIDKFQKIAQDITKIEDIENSVDLHKPALDSETSQQLEMQVNSLESIQQTENQTESEKKNNMLSNQVKNSSDKGH